MVTTTKKTTDTTETDDAQVAAKTEAKQPDLNKVVADLQKENLKLIKVIITPNEAHKREHQGELFSVGNDVLPTISNFIPFGVEWCIPNIMLKVIEAKEYQHFMVRKTKDGKEYIETKMLPAYQVQRLPNPTKEELAELAERQRTRNAVED